MCKIKLVISGISIIIAQLLYITPIFAFFQQVEWANEVIEFSSELSPIEFSAEQATGRPNIYPEGGENPNGWLPLQPQQKEFLKLGFEKAMCVSQIAIAESLNPGSITEIFLYDLNGKEYNVFTNVRREIKKSRRLFNVVIDKTPYKANAVKIISDNTGRKKWSAIDAVAIADTSIPIIIEVYLEKGIDVNVSSDRLSDNVNSSYPETSPVVAPSGKQLFFTRSDHPDNGNNKGNIWFSQRENKSNTWSEAVNLTALNKLNVSKISSITPDGKSFLVVIGNDIDNQRLAMVNKTSQGWTKPTEISIKDIEDTEGEKDYYLANNRRTLLITAKKTGGNGGKDIYVSFSTNDGQWSEPKNLGKTVNSASDEKSPFLAKDDKTLYFSSNGYAGYGGSDIYVTRRLDDTWQKWTPPQNMGPGINDKNDDTFFNMPPDNKEAYFSRELENGDSDIFTMNIPKLYRPKTTVKIEGKVIDIKTKKPLSTKVIYTNAETLKIIGETISDPKTGAFEVYLPYGKIYNYLAEKDDYFSESKQLDLTKFNKGGVVYKKNIQMTQLTEEAKLLIKDIIFEKNDSVLPPGSKKDLLRVIDILKKYPKLKIEVAGHTDKKEKSQSRLSKNRAKSVKNFLVFKGAISPNRISIKNYGSEIPVDKKEKDKSDNGGKNRRVELKITQSK